MSEHPIFSLQFVTHLANDHTVRQLVDLAGVGRDCGFSRVWVNENVGYRNQAVILSAIASSVAVDIGTAVMVPYFHHPLDSVGMLNTLSELAGGREIRVALARGDIGQSTQHITADKPVQILKEFTRFLRAGVSGERAYYKDFPELCSYYRLNENGSYQTRYGGDGRFTFFGGGGGPKALALTGREMDGMLTSSIFLPLARLGRLDDMHRVAEAAAHAADPGKHLDKACVLNVSISRDREAAVNFPRRQAAHSVLQWETLGFTEQEYEKLGVNRSDVLALKDHWASGGSLEDAARLVSDEIVHACYIAGTPKDVEDELNWYIAEAVRLGYTDIVAAKLGPRYDEAIRLLANDTSIGDWLVK